jgi:hypothetical protein
VNRFQGKQWAASCQSACLFSCSSRSLSLLQPSSLLAFQPLPSVCLSVCLGLYIRLSLLFLTKDLSRFQIQPMQAAATLANAIFCPVRSRPFSFSFSCLLSILNTTRTQREASTREREPNQSMSKGRAFSRFRSLSFHLALVCVCVRFSRLCSCASSRARAEPRNTSECAQAVPQCRPDGQCMAQLGAG